DMVREGVSWFQFLGSAPLRQSASVASSTFAAGYGAPSSAAATLGERKVLAVTVTNTGNVTWPAAGPNPVNLSYHVFDASGRTVVWDGERTGIGADLAPGASRSIDVAYTAPTAVGSYTLAVEAVREGVAWFSGLGVPAARLNLSVTSGFNAGYGASTTPAQAALGATLSLTADLTNYGTRAWPAGGANPVRLSYHIFSSSGATVVWDGRRGLLPADVAPNQTVRVTIDVTLPSATGSYVLAWDMVQEGVAWFSQLGVPQKRESISVVPGVTFFGKGNGHGVGMSQFGALGWATGASGPPLTAEQIVAKYYTGTQIASIDPASPNNLIRVLLSAPSSQGRFNCSGTKYMDTWLANASSAGGFRVLDEGAGNALIGASSAGTTWQIAARGGVLEVWDNATSPPTQKHKGSGPVVLVPLDATKPIALLEKGTYRGNLRFTNLGNTLRTTNVLGYDDYVKGVIPLEMPFTWHAEAIKAQAYAARTYAYSSYVGGARDFDVHDDQSDQCYGGTAVEKDTTTAATIATAGRIVTHNGTAIRAYFSSSSGGYTLGDGCWGSRVVVSANAVSCGPNQPYLQPIADPADLAVTTPVTNRHASWSATFTGAQIRDAVLAYTRSARGVAVDIGTLLSVDLSNRSPANVGHAVSVKIQGTTAVVDVPADAFLRNHLLLRSTMVRLSPF
ncbi:MAG: SpoIID/LytB domain-containing protein, partial [Candidatus Limnocylindria bacterium]